MGRPRYLAFALIALVVCDAVALPEEVGALQSVQELIQLDAQAMVQKVGFVGCGANGLLICARSTYVHIELELWAAACALGRSSKPALLQRGPCCVMLPRHVQPAIVSPLPPPHLSILTLFRSPSKGNLRLPALT